jgi:type I thyroxine 5'-deiodinase
VVFANPRTAEEKAGVARTCARKLDIRFPTLVDDFSSTTELAFSGWPDRLYVVDRAGRIAYKARPGPFGFKPEEVAATLQRLLPSGAAAQGA